MPSNSCTSTASHRDTMGWSFSARALSGVMAVTDAVCVFAVGSALYVTYFGWNSGTYSIYVGTSVLGSLLLTGTLSHNGHYNPQVGNDFLQQAKTLAATWAGVFLALILAAYSLKISASVSRLWSFSWFISALLLILLQRLLVWQLIRKAAVQGRLVQRIAILGASHQGKRLLKHLEQWAEPWVTVTGVFDDRLSRVGHHVLGYPVKGNFEDLLRFVSEDSVDNILIALPGEAEQRLSQLTGRLRELSVDVYLASDLLGRVRSDEDVKLIARSPMLRLVSRPLEGWRWFLKETEDRLLAVPILFFLAPLMLIIALAIKLDSKGPIMYRQERSGFNKKSFTILKFRTMYRDECCKKSFQQAQRNDPRVTRVGRILRRMSLDELPQLINVLKGDMSLIGPRPHPLPLDEQYAPQMGEYFFRNRVKPGLTGWAQVNGFRGDTSTLEKMEKRVAHDVYYIENWSLTFDIRILIMTAFLGFFHKHAY